MQSLWPVVLFLKKKKNLVKIACWHKIIILATREVGQEEYCNLKACLDYLAISCQPGQFSETCLNKSINQ